jgi:hypothetical protein
MAEVHAGAKVMTLDAHFQIYRLSNRCVVPVIMPG